jgi:2-oxoisovalerate dehydrogenase E1 component
MADEVRRARGIRVEPGHAPFLTAGGGRPLIPNQPAALYAFGSLIRACEQSILELFRQNALSGTTHTCLGQELCQMAVVRALADPHDAIWSNHRNHGHFLTYTGDFVGLVAELMGRTAGVCGGVGGSQHLRAGNFHSSGVQAGLTAVAVGHALSRKLRDEPGVTAIFVGDGTFGEGLLYESLNLASIWGVPVLFVVEHNGIAQTTPTAQTIAGSIVARGEAFGLPAHEVDDGDPHLFVAVEQIVERVRQSRQPAFLVIKTKRLGPHSKGDDCRDADEMAAIAQRDPLTRLGEMIPASERRRIETTNAAFIAWVCETAFASPIAHDAAGRQHILPSRTPSREFPRPRAGDLTVRASLNAALRRLLAADERVVLLGEDLHDPYGGAFKVTAGLSTAFPDRVISTPISEAGIVGAGIGLALAGARPIVEIMFADFLSLAMDQLFNHAVKLAGMFPDAPVPLTIRTATGGRRGYGPTHSQSTESLAAAVPGLTVVAPSHRHDPGVLLERAVRDGLSPAVFFEHKTLYATACDGGGYEPSICDRRDPASDLFPTLVKGPARADVTLVTYGGMVPIVEAVAARLEAEEDLVARIVIVSLLSPLPRHSLTALLLDGCRRMAVIEETHVARGFGAELGTVLLEAGYDGRFLRVGSPPVPIPASRSLEADVLPSEEFVLAQVSSLFVA